MSHTRRRRDSHTAHERGWGNQAPTSRQRRRPSAQAAQRVEPCASPVISSHAVLRWLERVEGQQLRAAVEAQILADGRDALIERIETGRIRVAGTRTTLVIRGGVVVDVILENARG
jgi:hypothetical protein